MVDIRVRHEQECKPRINPSAQPESVRVVSMGETVETIRGDRLRFRP